MKLCVRFLAFLFACLYVLSPVSLVFAAATTTQSAPKPTCSMTVSPTSISPGGAVTLKWESTNATGGSITGVGGVGPSGSINLLPSTAAQTTFVGSFAGPGGTASCQATVTVSANAGGGDSGGATLQTPTTQIPVTQAPVATTPASTNTTVQSGKGGLVPCGWGVFTAVGSDSHSSTGCRACNLAQLVQLLINFCIGLSIPIAAALFAYAGILYFTSGANEHNIDKAKEIFKNAFVGFIIAITAWLVINTLLHALLDGGHLFASGSWFTIQCAAPDSRPVNTNINQVLSSLPLLNSGGTPAAYTGGNTLTTGSAGGATDPKTGAFVSNPSAGQTGTCGSGNYYDASAGAAQCYNSDGTAVGAPTPYPAGSTGTSAVNVGTAQMNAQLAAACLQYGLNNCSIAQYIAGNESSGGRDCTTSSTGAAGCMQVLATTACSIDSTIDSSCGACISSKNSTSAACAPVIQTIGSNPQLGTSLGVQYISQLQNMSILQPLQSQYGTCQITAAAYFQGPGTVIKAGGIPTNIKGVSDYVAKACPN